MSKFLKENTKLKWKFQRGGGRVVKPGNLPWMGYNIFCSKAIGIKECKL